MHATVLQVNVSQGGIPKLPVRSAELTRVGLATDRHAHPNIHGGPEKAVLVISSEGIAELKESGFAVYPGALGENLTTEGLDRRTVRIGQRYRVGETILRISKVRQPCDTLTPLGTGIQRAVYDADVKAKDPSSPVWGLSGFYASVEKTGIIRPGDSIELLSEEA